MDKSFDVIVFGASGFTGSLVAEYLSTRYGVGGTLAWAIAGRSVDKLARVRERIGASKALPLLVADADDPASLAGLVRQAKVIISTVGPYQLHGRALVSACAMAGTDYVDLCGEPAWMAQMIDLLQAPARVGRSRIVFSCGFDSIPFDLGVLFLQEEARRRFGVPLQRVLGRVRVMKGEMSGGTVPSPLATFERMGREPGVARTMADPFALTPGFQGPAQPDDAGPVYDEPARSWSSPFVMATINTKNIHRSNALLGHPWGRDFVYDERMLTGDGSAGEARARAQSRMAGWQNRLLGFAPTRALLRRFALPKPGQGPNAQQRESGRYELLFIGMSADGRTLRALVKGDRDPGYGSTCKLVAEAALCLAHEVPASRTPGGVWTPAAAMGMTLVRRLQQRAGLSFAIED
jgi:short subunit dehydrogenase-like uncharacterized protein